MATKVPAKHIREAADAFTRASAALLPIRLEAWNDRDLTVTQLRVLRQIDDNDGLGNMALAHLLSLTKSAVSFQLERLQRRGFIRREVSLSDRRGIHIFMEPAGREALNAAVEPVRNHAASLLAGLTEEQVKDLGAAFSLLSAPGKR